MFAPIKKYRNNRSEEGFTLIELMIVVVIIGILAAIAIPIFLNQQKSAMISTAKTDAKNASLAVTTWTSKNKGKLPTTCPEIRELVKSHLSVTEGNVICYAKQADTENYYIRAYPKGFPSSANPSEPEDDVRIFFIPEKGKLFSNKNELTAGFGGSSGLNAWINQNWMYADIQDDKTVSNCTLVS